MLQVGLEATEFKVWCLKSLQAHTGLKELRVQDQMSGRVVEA